MSKRTEHAPGSRCWVDLATPDVDAAAGFYGSLLGWEIPELENSAEMGGHRGAKKGGRRLRGGSAAEAGGPAPGLPQLHPGGGCRRARGGGGGGGGQRHRGAD